MISRMYILLILAIVSTFALAQEKSEFPLIQSCVPSTQCEMGMGKLDESERQLIQKLISIVPLGATETQIAKSFGSPPFRKVPPAQAFGQPKGTMAYKAYWSTADPPSHSGGPHFDVLFFNDRAVMFSWYSAWVGKTVRVYLTK